MERDLLKSKDSGLKAMAGHFVHGWKYKFQTEQILLYLFRAVEILLYLNWRHNQKSKATVLQDCLTLVFFLKELQTPSQPLIPNIEFV